MLQRKKGKAPSFCFVWEQCYTPLGTEGPHQGTGGYRRELKPFITLTTPSIHRTLSPSVAQVGKSQQPPQLTVALASPQRPAVN